MYAVIKTGGKQYRVARRRKAQGRDSSRPTSAPRSSLDQVLMVGDGDSVKVGTPLVAGASVTATVVAHGRGEKVRIFKMRRRKHYQQDRRAIVRTTPKSEIIGIAA